MNELMTHILIVLVPLLFTNCLHMVVVKLNWFSFLKIPLSEKAFGKNKTWRGIVFIPLVNAVFLWLIAQLFKSITAQPALIGCILGLSYCLFELPNSFFKRRIGIASGEAHHNYKYLFYAIDKTDSAFGVTLMYYFISGITPQTALALFLINIFTHVFVSLILTCIKIKPAF